MKFENIKIWIFDLDGVLTDGKFTVSRYQGYEPNVSKTFSINDTSAIFYLRENGYQTFIVSGSNHVGKEYGQLMGIETFTGVHDKVQLIENVILKNSKLKWENVAFVGDAENDTEVLKLAGLSLAPSNHIHEDVDLDYVSDKMGGNGAVHEMVKWFFSHLQE